MEYSCVVLLQSILIFGKCVHSCTKFRTGTYAKNSGAAQHGALALQWAITSKKVAKMMALQKMDQRGFISILFGSRKIPPTPPMPALLIPPQCPWLARKKNKLFWILWYIIYPCLRVTGRAQVLRDFKGADVQSFST